MSSIITASMLYDLVQCPHRVMLDLYEDPVKRDPESKFMQLLWERGTLFEQKVMQDLAVEFTDLSGKTSDERELLTQEAIARGYRLIYAGRIRSGNLLGDPDLLRLQGDGYVAGDIKSGAGEEGANDSSEGRPKKHYAVQLAFYTDVLERMGMSAGRYPFIWDVHGDEVVYDLDAPQGTRHKQSLWQFYEDCLRQAGRIVSRREHTRPALSSTCKLCHWRSVCINHLEELDDLSLIPALGRSRRDTMLERVKSVSELARMDISALVKGKITIIPGIGLDTLEKFQHRARLQKSPDARPYLKQPVKLPNLGCELFFDIETDPLRDFCYLHGFVERHNKNKGMQRYIHFFAEAPTDEEEKKVFSEALAYAQSRRPCVIYYFSKYERTWWYKLQERYPEVATREQVEDMLNSEWAIDLYSDVVLPYTEWPTRDYSIKTLAKYLGFGWRDPSPSGAESIEWYYSWIETGDSSIKLRILEYNEDDCIAMRVLLDGLIEMSAKF
jgi:predicted RecB family nuclease